MAILYQSWNPLRKRMMANLSSWMIGGLGLTLLSSCSGPAVSPEVPTADPEAIAPATPVPPPPPRSAYIALLTPEQTAEIKALAIPLVVPTAIPAGFVVESVAVHQEDRFTDYQILYRDTSDRCFLVEYASGGLGGIPTTEYRLPINPPLFAVDGVEYGLNYGPYTDDYLREQSPEPELISDWLWLENAGGYRIAGAAYINSQLDVSTPCQDIEPEEAVTLIESLALMTDDITGDGP